MTTPLATDIVPLAPAPDAGLVAVPAGAPRVVVFGPPGHGKSTLFKLLCKHVSGAEPRSALEVVSYGGRPVALIDTTGHSAAELLAHPGAVTRRGGLAGELRQADALVVVVDALNRDDIRETFAAFEAFLLRFRAARTDDRTVGGLPVFLALTKCDALYLENDQPTDWENRVRLREEEIATRFDEYFPEDPGGAAPAADAPTDVVYSEFEPTIGATATPESEGEPAADAGPRPAGFGTLQFDLIPTAERVPPGTAFASLADETGGFQVARLADAVFAAAADHRDRSVRARTRLRRTVLGVGALLAVAVAAGVGLFTATVDPADRLAGRVRAYRDAEPVAAVRLSDRRLPRTLRELASIRADRGYDGLSAELHDYVEGRSAEAATYRDWRAKYDPPRLGPAEITSRTEAAALKQALDGELAPPREYAAAWADTEAMLLRGKWRRDLELLAATEDEFHNFYRNLVTRANNLALIDTEPSFAWRQQVQALLGASSPRGRPGEAIPGSPTAPGPRGKPLTFSAVFRTDRVSAAAADFADARARLEGLRDLSDAVGLSTGRGTPGSVLDLPTNPAEDARNSLELATQTLAALRVAFPAAEGLAGTARGHFPAWVDRPFADAPRKAVEARLRTIRDSAVRHVRRVLSVRLGVESPERWRALATDVLATPALKDWDLLLVLLDDLLGPPARQAGPRVGPVEELRAFLLRTEFEADIPEFRLALPAESFDRPPTPAGEFVLTVTPPGGTAGEFRFKADPDPRAGGFVFRPAGHPGKLVFRPGDAVLATLPVRAGAGEFKLVWANGRSGAYQFGRLAEPPRVEAATGAVVAPQAAGVTWTVPPPGRFPRVPALLPDPRVP